MITKRESYLGAAILIMGIIATHLWLQLHDAREQISGLREAQVSVQIPARASPLPVAVPNLPGDPSNTTEPADQTAVAGATLPAPSEPEPAPVAMQRRTLTDLRKPDVKSVMAGNDLNKDGLITQDEARKAGKFLALGWDRYDLNKDGMVTAEEVNETATKETQSFGNGARRGGQFSGGVPPDAVVSSNDLNGDGIITRDEARSANRNLNRQWDTYDVNKDGVVDLRELNSAQGRGGK